MLRRLDPLVECLVTGFLLATRLSGARPVDDVDSPVFLHHGGHVDHGLKLLGLPHTQVVARIHVSDG